MGNPSGRLRPLHYARDMEAVAELLRVGFPTVEHDPRDRQILRRYLHATRWAPPGPTTEADVRAGQVPFFGWVWEQRGRVVGFVAVAPAARRHYVLANIVVHPDYRGRGIGRALVQHALAYIARRRAYAHLEVAEDNRPAQRLYQSLGFVYQETRAEWRYALRVTPTRAWTPTARVRALRGRDWPQVRAWLEEVYPQRLAWYWEPAPLHRTLRPGLLGALWRWWAAAPHGLRWAVDEAARLRGLWACWPEPAAIQRLYLIAAPDLSAEGVRAGLWALAHELEPIWRVTPQGQTTEEPYYLYLSLPAARHEAALQAAGWQQRMRFWRMTARP